MMNTGIDNPCTSCPCKNGGTCSPDYDWPNGSASYKCSCPDGFSGERCQFVVECYSLYCLNGGYCKLNYVGVPYCVCSPGYYGSYCENSNKKLD